MESFQKSITEYKKQLGKGYIQEAYKGLMEYIMGLRVYLQNKYPDYYVSGNIYYGYMDMTYFAFMPKSLKNRSLKIAVVFIHETLKFEVWLAGNNKSVQTKYLDLFKASRWNKYHLAPAAKGVDYIAACTLAENPDFNDLDALTMKIETGTQSFINEIERLLSKH